jgi:hypothetical protein
MLSDGLTCSVSGWLEAGTQPRADEAADGGPHGECRRHRPDAATHEHPGQDRECERAEQVGGERQALDVEGSRGLEVAGELVHRAAVPGEHGSHRRTEQDEAASDEAWRR